MFRGISNINLDAKGRMALPTRYREQLVDCCDSQMVVTIDNASTCLMLYPTPEWEEIERKLVRLPNQNPAARRLQRMLLGHATEVEMDGHGRILIPPRLRDYASLDKRIVFIGQGHRFEIWDEQTWEQAMDEWRGVGTQGELPEPLENLSL